MGTIQPQFGYAAGMPTVASLPPSRTTKTTDRIMGEMAHLKERMGLGPMDPEKSALVRRKLHDFLLLKKVSKGDPLAVAEMADALRARCRNIVQAVQAKNWRNVLMHLL
jgi:hypothetical protein